MAAHPSPSIIPHLVVSPAADAIEFYRRAFGFSEAVRMNTPNGKVRILRQRRLGQIA